jgi:hypothetical protein
LPINKLLQKSLRMQREEKAKGTKGAGNRGEGRASFEARFNVGISKNDALADPAAVCYRVKGVEGTLEDGLCRG